MHVFILLIWLAMAYLVCYGLFGLLWGVAVFLVATEKIAFTFILGGMRAVVKMTFKAWLMERRVTDTPRGDFILDMRTDARFPEGRSWDEIRQHLLLRGACPEAVKVARRLWREFDKVRAKEAEDSSLWSRVVCNKND
jgi:hypothetical protein